MRHFGSRFGLGLVVLIVGALLLLELLAGLSIPIIRIAIAVMFVLLAWFVVALRRGEFGRRLQAMKDSPAAFRIA